MKKTNPKTRRETRAILYTSVLRYIMNIFYGPFLTMYFFKISYDSVQPIAIYSILCYTIVGLLPILLGFIVRKRFQVATFRLGIIINLIYIIFIMVLREGIVDHLEILALLSGASTALFFYPHNILNGALVDRASRDRFEIKKKFIISVAGIVIPFLLGIFITATDFIFATGIILLLSVAQIILSLLLKPVNIRSEHFTPVRSLRSLLKNPNVRRIYRLAFYRGMTVSDSAMQVMMTLLIFNSFETNLDLGIVTSVSNLLLVGLSYLYLHSRRCRDNKWVLLSFALIPLLSLLLFLGFTSDLTLIIYYLCYTIFSGILQILITIKIYNVSNLPTVKRGNTAEYWAIYEPVQACGRVLSFALLLVAGIFGQFYLYALYLLLTLMLVPLTSVMRKIKD